MLLFPFIFLVNTLDLYIFIPLLSQSKKITFFPVFMGYLMFFEFIFGGIFIYYYHKLKNLMQRHRNEEYNNIKNGLQR